MQVAVRHRLVEEQEEIAGGHGLHLKLKRANVCCGALGPRRAALISGGEVGGDLVNGWTALGQGMGEGGTAVVRQGGVQDVRQRRGDRTIGGGGQIADARGKARKRIGSGDPTMPKEVDGIDREGPASASVHLIAGIGRGTAGDEHAVQRGRAATVGAAVHPATVTRRIAAHRAVFNLYRAAVIGDTGHPTTVAARRIAAPAIEKHLANP